jgi:hypothetical protein
MNTMTTAPSGWRPEDERRIRMTASCRDCDSLPKVAGAGETAVGAEGAYQVMHNGVRIVEGCYFGPWMTEVIRRLRGHHEPQEERAFAEVLQHVPAGGAMLELGSFWGYYSLWFQRQVALAVNFLIEPDPARLAVGQRNFALNGAAGSFHQMRPVEQISVDDFLAAHGLDALEVLLADIQGAELEMLAGAAGSIAAGRIRFLVLSTHHHSIARDPLIHQKCLQRIRQQGAHVLAEHTVAESFSGDGLIVASFRPADRSLPRVEISHNRAADGLFRELEHDVHDAWDQLAEARRRIEELEADRAGRFDRRLWRLLGRLRRGA